MSAIRSILVGVDFSPCSSVALTQAIRLAAVWRATVHPLHVIDTIAVTDLEQALAPLQREIRGELLRSATQAWHTFAAQIEGAGSIEVEVAINNRVTAVLDAATRVRADLVVLGAYSREDPDLGIGTTASACVRRATADVLLARDDHRGPYERIVVGVDFSETSRHALERAVELAATDGAELHVLHVFVAPWHGLQWLAPAEVTSTGFQQEARTKLEERLRTFSAPILSAARPGGGNLGEVHHAIFEHHGHRSGIVDYAKRTHADMIVVGTRGRTNVRDVLLGSTAEKTLRDCTTSVLAVKPRTA